MALPGVEITITLDDIDADGNETQSNQPKLFVHGAQTVEQEQERKNHQQQEQLRIQAQEEKEQSQEQTHQGQSGSTRPKLLPFLSEIRNRGQARQTGMFQHD